MSDETQFYLNGSVNRQNCRIWSTEPPYFSGKPLHSLKVNVWCWILAKGVIYPYLFEGAAYKPLTVNGERYRHMIEAFLKPYLNAFDTEVFIIIKMVPHHIQVGKQLHYFKKFFFLVSVMLFVLPYLLTWRLLIIYG